MDVLSSPMKDNDTNFEDETVEEQTDLNNILSSKDTTMHTEFIIKNEEEIGDTSLLNTEYIIKDEEEDTSLLVKEEFGDSEMKVEGSSAAYEQQLRVELKGKKKFYIVESLASFYLQTPLTDLTYLLYKSNKFFVKIIVLATRLLCTFLP